MFFTSLSCGLKSEDKSKSIKLERAEILDIESIKMEFPFDIKKLNKNLQEILNVERGKINWTLLVQLSKKERENDSSNVDLNFCYAYALFNESLNIHIDDLKETIEVCKKLINNFDLDTNSKIEFKNQLEKTLELVISKEKEVEILNSINLDSLSLKEMKELAFSLSDKGGVENYRKSAIIYGNLFGTAQQEYNKFQYLGRETIALFRSSQYNLAEPKFHMLIEWDIEKGPSANPWVIDFVFSEMLLNNAKNKERFLELWNKAKNHSIIKENENFPMAYSSQDKILAIALDLELKEVLSDLIPIYNEKREKNTKSEQVLGLIENAKNVIQQKL